VTKSSRWRVKHIAVLCFMVLGAWWALKHFFTSNVHSETHVERPTVVWAPKLNKELKAHGAQPAGVFGSVHSSDGVVIAGASVCTSCGFPQCGSPGPAEILCVSTDQQGRYELNVLSSGRYRLFASAPRYQTALANYGVDREQLFVIDAAKHYEVDFVLEEGGARVSGIVVDAMGGPIADTVITASAQNSTRIVGGTARSDDQGRFELFVEPGPLILRARAPGYAWRYHSVTAPDESVELVLAPASQLSGLVVSAVDGAPVPDVEVRATKIIAAVLTPGDGAATSDSEGRFNIDGLSEGDYDVTAHSPQWYGRIPDKVRLRLAESVSSLRLEVRPGVSVKGEVTVEPRSEPCTGGIAALSALPGSAGSAFRATAPINANGQVRFQAIPSGDFRVQIQCMNYPSSNEFPVLKVLAKDIEGLKWSVKRGLSITGRVVDGAGRALAGKVVFARPVNEINTGGVFGPGGISTDENGRFLITGLSANTYRVAVQDDQATAQTVSLIDGSEPSSVTLVVRASATIRIRVSSASPINAALQVQAMNGMNIWQAQRTDTDRYQLRTLPAGSYNVYVSDGRNTPLTQTVELHDGETLDVSFTLPTRLATLRGRLVDEHRNPLADVWLRVTPSETLPLTTDSPPGATVLTDADGRFSIPNLSSADVYDVIAVRGQKETVLQRGVIADKPLILVLSSASDPGSS
jgi:hypothetical protein